MARQSRSGSGDQDGENVSGGEAIEYSVADFIGSKEVAKAAAEWIYAKAKTTPQESGIKILSLWLGFSFGILIFAGVGTLAYLRVINEQVAAGLLGTLIGYWFGQRGKPN